jgi:hypothetical protein
MRHLRLFAITALSGCLTIAGCASEFAVVPRGGSDRAVAQVNGITIVAFANQWESNPDDLADYVTPIAVELYNPGPNEVRVTYADLALRDSSGFRYAAVNPFLPATGGDVGEGEAPTSYDDGSPGAKPVLLASNGPIVLAAHFGGGGGGFHGGGGGFHGGGGFRGGAVRVGPPGGGRIGPGAIRVGPGRAILPPRVGVGVGVSPMGRHYGGGYGGRGYGYYGGGWSGFRAYGGLRGYYGLGIGYWGGPWFYPPYYGDWVSYWGPSYYPARPSMDVLSLGLPEGVLPPGARVSGFLYFKRATGAHQGDLDLSWDVHDANSGAALATLHVPLEVVQK